MPKKRNHGDGALYYIKAKKLWRASIDLEPWPDGRRHQLMRTSRTAQGARDKIAAAIKEIEAHGGPLKTSTVAEWSAHWLKEVCQPRMKPNGLAAYESVMRTWIVKTVGTKKVADLKPSDVRLVVKKIMNAGLSSSTARKTYNVMSGMLEDARREGLCLRNVAEDVTPPKMAVSNRGPLEDTDARSVLGAALSLPDGTRWLVAILGGLRQSERLGAQISSFNFSTNTLAVEWALDEIASEHGCENINGKWACGYKQGAACPQSRLKVSDGFEYRQLAGRLCLIRPKSGKTRTVPLLPQVSALLRDYIESRQNFPNPHGLIWHHDDGTPYLPREDEQAWRDLLQMAGVITKEQNFPGSKIPTGHWARHTTATVMMELGVNNKIVGEVVGHQSEAVTARYQHVNEPAARAAMTQVGEKYADVLRIEPKEASA